MASSSKSLFAFNHSGDDSTDAGWCCTRDPTDDSVFWASDYDRDRFVKYYEYYVLGNQEFGKFAQLLEKQYKGGFEVSGPVLEIHSFRSLHTTINRYVCFRCLKELSYDQTHDETEEYCRFSKRFKFSSALELMHSLYDFKTFAFCNRCKKTLCIIY